jgi:ATP-binding cassette subfamily F protein uup
MFNGSISRQHFMDKIRSLVHLRGDLVLSKISLGNLTLELMKIAQMWLKKRKTKQRKKRLKQNNPTGNLTFNEQKRIPKIRAQNQRLRRRTKKQKIELQFQKEQLPKMLLRKGNELKPHQNGGKRRTLV